MRPPAPPVATFLGFDKQDTASDLRAAANIAFPPCHPSDVWIVRWQLYLMLSIITLIITAAVYANKQKRKKRTPSTTKRTSTADDVDEEQPRTLADKHTSVAPPERMHYLDFSRSVLVGGVVLYHVSQRVQQIYRDDELKRGVKSEADYKRYDNAINTWRLLGWAFFPCFFYVAGRASAVSRERRILKIMMRSTRYIPHLIVGWVVLVLPVTYLSMQFNKKTNVDFFQWLSNQDGHLAADLEYTGLGWLWYIPIHMIIEVIEAPLHCTLKGSFNMYRMLALATIGSILTAWLINFAVAMVCVTWMCITMTYIAREKFLRTIPMTPICMTIIVVASLIAVNVRSELPTIFRVLKLQSMIFFILMHSMGVVHGIFPDVSVINGWIILPCAIAGAFAIGFCFPDSTEPGASTRFPPYKTAQVFPAWRFVALSWICLYCVVSLFQNSDAVKNGHPIFNSAFTLYLMHWPFLEVFLDLGIVPHLCRIPAEIALAMTVCFTFAACWGVHFLIFPTKLLKDENLLGWVEKDKSPDDEDSESDKEDVVQEALLGAEPHAQSVIQGGVLMEL